MILIADSGSSKTSWALLSGDGVTYINTSGINPVIQDASTITHIIFNELLPQLKSHIKHIKQIAFYGSGCNTKGCEILGTILPRYFSADLECDSDLKGSALATLGNSEGIVSILGTGSNSGCFKNGELLEHIPSLGFILGDEGSGSYLGKQLLSDYFKKQMPQKLSLAFQKEFTPVETEIIDIIYHKNRPNKFLAAFVPFIINNIDDPYCTTLVKNGFESFFIKNICAYSNYQNYTLNFTGSVAYGFQNLLNETAASFGLKINTVLKHPIQGMVKHFMNQL